MHALHWHSADRSQTCGICLEPFKNDECVLGHTIEHVFHERCARSWHEIAQNCPLCRILLQKNIRPIVPTTQEQVEQHKALLAAARQGREDLVHRFIQDPEMPEIAYYEAAIVAARTRHPTITKMIVGELSEEDRGTLVCGIVDSEIEGRIAFLQFLLKDGPISNEDRTVAIDTAQKNYEPAVIDLLQHRF